MDRALIVEGGQTHIVITVILQLAQVEQVIRIVFIEYFVEEERDYRLETGIPLEEGRWQQLEKGALEALPGLTEVRPQKETLWKRLLSKG